MHLRQRSRNSYTLLPMLFALQHIHNIAVLPNEHLIQTLMYGSNVLFRPLCVAVMSYSDPYVWQ